MKKKYIVLAVVIILIAAIPFAMGMLVQNEFEAQLEKIAEYPGYKIEVTEYNRGLLNSTAKVRVAYDVAVPETGEEFEKKFAAAIQEGVLVNFDIDHGPLLSKPGFGPGFSYTVITLDDSQGFVQEAEKLFGVDELVTAEARVELGGAGKGFMQIPALNYSEEGKTFSFGGANIDFELEDFGKKYNSKGSIAAFNFQSDIGQIESSPIVVSGEGEYGNSLYGTGTFKGEMAFLKISGDKQAAVEDIKLDVAVTAPEAGLMDVAYKIELAKVSGSDLPHELKDTIIDIAVHNIRESAVTKLSELGSPDFSDPEAAMAYQQKTNAAMTELLAGSPELEIKEFAFKFGEDAWMDLKGKLSIDGEIAGKPEAQGNPFMLIPAITANYTANLSESMVAMAVQQYLTQQFADSGMSPEEIEEITANQEQQTSMMIGQFVATGFLQKTDVGYRVETSFKSGELLVNGNPIPMPF